MGKNGQQGNGVEYKNTIYTCKKYLWASDRNLLQ
jgi:hypothetical protein